MDILRGGTLRFWGDWFGRPLDNYHTVVSAEYDDKDCTLIIIFAEAEKCTIFNPSGIVNTKKEFYVSKAKKVIWEWYYYGREHISENLCKREYIWLDNKTVSVEYSGANGTLKKVQNPSGYYALELC